MPEECRNIYKAARRAAGITQERAAELLCTTNQPIAQVASAVGYESVSQFGMVFKRQYRMTPSQYRRQFRRKMSKTGELCLNPNVLP